MTDEYLADLRASDDRDERIDQSEALAVVGELIRTRAVLRRLLERHGSSDWQCRLVDGGGWCKTHGWRTPCPPGDGWRLLEQGKG